MQIRAAIYRAFPNRLPADLDRLELWQLGVMMGNDLTSTLSDTEQAELDEITRLRSERMREAAEQKRQARGG